MKILIVDDSKAIFIAVTEMLTRMGHVGTWAMDGQKAIEILATSEKFDAILLDWNMPNMTGPEFLEKNLKDKITSTPIIMMTTENKPEFIKKAISLGVAEYMMKPFTPDILANKLEMALGML